ncbi:MAG: rhomboid family intramembrane serine protease [Candidatus Bathyarchaeota archaeon]|nr:rhomboid family intramembrane serine protease [Candidatus Bathyarchaeota archaeon]
MEKSSQKFRVTYVLIAVTIAAYVYTSIAGGDAVNTSASMVYQWGQWNFAVFHGLYYQLFTSMFVHASIAHLAGNMLFLLIFGLRGEELFSLPEYLGIYFIGGLMGNLLSLSFGPDFVSVGASGAIFSLFGACVIYTRRSVRQSIVGALGYAFFLLLFSSGAGVNDLAHIGGLVFGLVAGYLLASRRKPEDQYNIRFSMTTPF